MTGWGTGTQLLLVAASSCACGGRGGGGCGGGAGGGGGAIGGDSGGGGGGGEPSSIHAFQINFRPHVRERLKKRSHRKIQEKNMKLKSI